MLSRDTDTMLFHRLHGPPAGFPRVPANEDSIFGFKPLSSNGSNVKIVNNGHTVQVVSRCGAYWNTAAAGASPLLTG